VATSNPNRLAQEKSPYLLQHADNPVEWMPWGDDAFEKARREEKPIFLSVGYSTCHWCHVMAYESFDDEATAEIMNREFVNIKVDREERPDVDRVYMTFVQATTGHGGWPMSVWLTPDLKPFVGGTYFPPEDRYGHPGFKRVLQQIATAWKQDRANISKQGTRIVEALAESANAGAGSQALLGPETLVNAYQQIARGYDAHEGGFGTAPKFPRPVTLNFLFGSTPGSRRLDGQERARDEPLHAAQNGGRRDARSARRRFCALLGGSVLARAAFRKDALRQRAARGRLCRRISDHARAAVRGSHARHPRLRAPRHDCSEGGFYSAEDADSIIEHGKPAHAEGAFYVWSKEEIDAALRDSAEIFSYHYGVKSGGNAPAGSDPHHEFTGKNILIQRHTRAKTAERFGRPEGEIRELLTTARRTLFELREKRPRPHLDDKIITAWNGLMISGLRAPRRCSERRSTSLRRRRRRASCGRIYTIRRRRRWCGTTVKGRVQSQVSRMTMRF
jgi:uncharacterized protein YyaL (SSP411 family)